MRDALLEGADGTGEAADFRRGGARKRGVDAGHVFGDAGELGLKGGIDFFDGFQLGLQTFAELLWGAEAEAAAGGGWNFQPPVVVGQGRTARGSGEAAASVGSAIAGAVAVG